jgi:hypothetical protein
VKPSGRVKATEYHDGYTIDAMINTSLSRTCYKKEAERNTGREGRIAEQKKKEEEAAAAAKKAAGGG